MNKILHVIQREYLVRIRKRTFWILTFLGPLLYALLIALPIITKLNVEPDIQRIYVIDKSSFFQDCFKDRQDLKFQYVPGLEMEKLKTLIQEDEKAHILIIPETSMDDLEKVEMLSVKNAGLQLISDIKSLMTTHIRNHRIEQLGLSQDIIENLEPDLQIEVRKISGEKSNPHTANIIAWISAFMNYFFIFLYGSLVLRGVQEEKSNRIVEIMVSAVRPFQIMLGKIIGIACVGLTQFLLWVILTLVFSFSIVGILGGGMLQEMDAFANPAFDIQSVFAAFEGIRILEILLVFVFYFIGGYLLYSSLFASIAAAVDNQTDMQQFMLPVSLPLIISIVFISFVTESPHASLSVWLSMIPFTSPVIMLARLPFGVEFWQLLLSMFFLIAGFIFTTWIAARIYRVGILMYGKKISYKDISKWIFYK
jgi:ABC-2 type transport system permease protein